MTDVVLIFSEILLPARTGWASGFVSADFPQAPRKNRNRINIRRGLVIKLNIVSYLRGISWPV